MARPLRIELAGGIYHVTSRGDRREAIYRDDADRDAWLAVFAEVCERFNWRCHAYCQMTNHYHLVVGTAEGNLSKGMRQLNGVFTQRVNRRHGLVGHLFQGRFKGILVDRDAYLLDLTRYVVLNPVRAGMVADAGDWVWSSYPAMLGRVPAPPWLETDSVLGRFGHGRAAARAALAAFVADGVGRSSIWDGLRCQVFLGSDDFVERHRGLAKDPQRLREVPRAQRRALAQPLSAFADQSATRREAMARAFSSGAYTMQEIAEHFGVHYSTVSRAVRRFERTAAGSAAPESSHRTGDFTT
ncbi:transposase [Thiocapsa sp.]|uniref:transposase n=1 Tax=Thiocapsa sp. TaxID=2024551 RepID=UPI002BE6D838|nr:transposase [Thiocapsa sp.]HSO81920.1 transposase [Thiocapsa sp.]